MPAKPSPTGRVMGLGDTASKFVTMKASTPPTATNMAPNSAIPSELEERSFSFHRPVPWLPGLRGLSCPQPTLSCGPAASGGSSDTACGSRSTVRASTCGSAAVVAGAAVGRMAASFRASENRLSDGFGRVRYQARRPMTRSRSTANATKTSPAERSPAHRDARVPLACSRCGYPRCTMISVRPL
jgi:hypothetical protein